jgi:hypothetical protein
MAMYYLSLLQQPFHKNAGQIQRQFDTGVLATHQAVFTTRNQTSVDLNLFNPLQQSNAFL